LIMTGEGGGRRHAVIPKRSLFLHEGLSYFERGAKCYGSN
jgi:hypothetical protein